MRGLCEIHSDYDMLMARPSSSQPPTSRGATEVGALETMDRRGVRDYPPPPRRFQLLFSACSWNPRSFTHTSPPRRSSLSLLHDLHCSIGCSHLLHYRLLILSSHPARSPSPWRNPASTTTISSLICEHHRAPSSRRVEHECDH